MSENNITRLTMASGDVKYVPLEIRNGTIGAQVAWMDSVSSATITLELTSFPGVSLTTAGNAWEWRDSGLTFTGPNATAASSLLINVENVRQLLARLKVTAAAATTLDVRDGAGS